MGHVLMDNRSGLAVDTRLTRPTAMPSARRPSRCWRRLPARAQDRGSRQAFDTEEFVSGCREINVTPHVAQNTYEYDTKTGKRARRESRIDARTTRHEGYRVSQVIRKLIETLFGDGKQHGATIRQVKLRGLAQSQRRVHAVHAGGQFAAAAEASGIAGDGGQWIDGKVRPQSRSSTRNCGESGASKGANPRDPARCRRFI